MKFALLALLFLSVAAMGLDTFGAVHYTPVQRYAIMGGTIFLAVAVAAFSLSNSKRRQ
jgi:hypothetical protein